MLKPIDVLMIALLVTIGVHTQPQEDCDGCHDHPLVPRYQQSLLVGYDSQQFDEQRLVTGRSSTTTAKGQATRLFYHAAEGRSGLQLFDHYKRALTHAGATTVWSCSGDTGCGADFAKLAVERMHLDFSNSTEARQGSADAIEPRYLLARLPRPEGDVFVAVLTADLEFHAPKIAGAYLVILDTHAASSAAPVPEPEPAPARAPAPAPQGDEPRTVYFPSRDGKTELVGYLFLPAGNGRHPAVVMLHGRAGPYSSRVNKDCTLVGQHTRSACNASTLSKRHQEWGHFWADRGYVALHVDSFGPRGKAHGFGRNTHDDPERENVNERTVRPLDAYGALDYLRTRNDVIADHVGVQGWSNGGSTVLNSIGEHNPALDHPTTANGFRAALALYPGCGREALFDTTFRSYAPLTVLLGGADEEVSPEICRHVLTRAKTAGSPVDFTVFEGATHDFDDPGENRQSVAANQTARAAAMKTAEAFFRESLQR
jgi:carboxymethylenebutenolidase